MIKIYKDPHTENIVIVIEKMLIAHKDEHEDGPCLEIDESVYSRDVTVFVRDNVFGQSETVSDVIAKVHKRAKETWAQLTPNERRIVALEAELEDLKKRLDNL